MQKAFFSFTEGQLTFYFDSIYWQVRKYDDHAYFQGFSGVGLKGVDFIGIYEGRTLILIEVKNYTWRSTPFREKDVRQSLQVPEQIAAAVRQKMEDTLAGLHAIGIYYQRKQARSWRWLDRFRKPDLEQEFWQRATNLLDQQQVYCLLWMETEATDAAFAKTIHAELDKQLVGGRFPMHFAQKTDYPFKASWKVDLREGTDI